MAGLIRATGLTWSGGPGWPDLRSKP